MLEALIEAALRSSALTALVWAILAAFRLRDPRVRSLAWTLVLVASLAMPFATRLASAVLPGIPVETNLWPSPETPLIAPPVAVEAGPIAVIPASAPPAPAPAHTARIWQAGAVALIAYEVIAGVLLLRLAAGLWLTLRVVRSARPVCASWTGDRDVRISAAIEAPATFGSVILLPPDFPLWPRAKRTAVLAHEAAHVERADFYIQLAAQLNRILFWFNPWSWWLQRRLCEAAEAASDDAAVRRLRDRIRYAEILLEVSRRGAPRGGVAMARSSMLRTRVERILSSGAQPATSGSLGKLALAAAVAALAVLAASPLARSSSPPAASALEEELAPHQRITIAAALLDADAGFYEDEASQTILHVRRDGDHLVATRTGRLPQPEYPYSDHDFFLTTAAEQESFVADASGAVGRVIHRRYGLATVYKRVTPARAGEVEADYERRLAEELKPHSPVAIDARLLDRYVGSYRLSAFYTLNITREGDQLYAQTTEQKRYAVFPYSDHDFFYTVVAAQLSFAGPPGAAATSLVLHQDGRDKAAPRVSAEAAAALQQRLEDETRPRSKIAVDDALLDSYVGNYAGPTLSMSILRDGDHLLARVLGYSGYRVYPYTERDFFATTIAAQVSFVRDAHGRAVQLIRHQHGEDVAMNRVE